MADNKQVYTAEEVAKLAPHYRGKPENFNPDKVGQGRKKSQKPSKPVDTQPMRVKAPPITKLPTPEFTHRNTKSYPAEKSFVT